MLNAFNTEILICSWPKICTVSADVVALSVADMLYKSCRCYKSCLLQALPLPRQNGLLQLVIGRLNDKSSQVRKNAIVLIIAMLQANPLAAQVCC